MDLKIKDVAELLNVSASTVRRWLKEGKIPAYQLHRQYRFNRVEIEDWMMRCKLNLDKDGFSPFEEKTIFSAEPDSNLTSGMQAFSLYRAMAKGGVLIDLPGKTKAELIRAVMQKSAPRLGLDADVMSELLLDREELMTTALNQGLAVPHARDTILEQPAGDCIITVFPQKPVDWGALDGELVHTLFFLFSSSDKTHLHLLSKLAHLSSREEALNLFISKPSFERLLNYIKNWESTISHKHIEQN